MGTKFDDQYFFVLRENNDHLPFLVPNDETAATNFDFEIMPLGSNPLTFCDGAFDWQKANRVKPVDVPPDYLFDASSVLVKQVIQEKFLSLDLPSIAFQPAIFIDHKNNRYENYWYLTFLNYFNCWDRKLSKFDPDFLDLDGERLYEVHAYSLNDKLLEKTELNDRKLFKMGGTLDSMIVAHVSITKHFEGSGSMLVPIAEFGVSYP